jgi:CDP-paratose 2-epimerase
MSQPKQVLVTGGAGFVGSHAVEYYAEHGADVTALDNLSRIDTLETADESRNTAAYNWEFISESYPDVDLVEGDIRDEDLMEEVVEGHDAIVHTAG